MHDILKFMVSWLDEVVPLFLLSTNSPVAGLTGEHQDVIANGVSVFTFAVTLFMDSYIIVHRTPCYVCMP